MAYNYYNPYQNQYYNQLQSQQPVVPPVAQPQQNNNGLIWVQGEAGAKSYMVAPNNTVMLMDSESQRFYLKSSDASGMPQPLRVFEYAELISRPKISDSGASSAQADTSTTYATKAEFEAFKSEINGILKNATKKEVEADG